LCQTSAQTARRVDNGVAHSWTPALAAFAAALPPKGE
jgi:hypothetical protein